MTHRFWAKILTWGLLLTPLTLFVYRQKTVYPLIFLKSFVFQIAVEILFLVWLVLVLRYPEYRPKIKKIHLAVAVWIAILLLTALTGVNIEKSFWSTQDRAIGIVFILHVFVFSLMLQTVAKQFSWRRLMIYLASVGAGVAGMAVVNHLAPKVFYVIIGDRPAGTLGNPSFLAGFLLFAIAITAWLALTASPVTATGQRRSYWLPLALIIAGVLAITSIYKLGIDDVLNIFGIGAIVWGLYNYLRTIERDSLLWYRISLFAILAFEVFVLFLANTRGAILALALGVMIMLVCQAWHVRRHLYRSGAAIALLLMFLFSVLFTATRAAPIWQKIPGFDRLAQLSTSDATVGNRAIVWAIALESFKERPLFGWGTDNFRYPFDLHYNPVLLHASSDETYWDKPHNVFLESLVTTGVVGFAAYLAIFSILFITLYRSKSSFKPFGYAILVAYMAQNFVFFDSFATYLMFFILIAFVADESHEVSHEVSGTFSSEKVPDTSIKPVVAIPIVAGSLVLVAWLVWVSGVSIYANQKQYEGLNYFANRMPDQAIDAYRKGFAVSYPYGSEIRQSYTASLKQLIGQIDIPHLTDAIDLSISEFPAAIAQDPNNHFLYFTMADARTTYYRVDKKYLAGATEELDIADKLSPRRQQTYYARARVKLALGDNAGGLAEMQKAIDLAPEVGEPHFYHALLSIGTASIDSINRELVQSLDAGFQPKSVQELKLVFSYFMLNEQYQLGADYFSELELGEVLLLEQQLDLGALAFKATEFDVARHAFEFVKEKFPMFLLTDRFNKDFKQMFLTAGVAIE